MADTVDRIVMDASQTISELAKLTSAFKAHNDAVDEVAVQYVEYNKKGAAVKATAQLILESGQAVDVMLKKSASGWNSYVTGINNATRAMKDFATATQIQAGATPAANFMKMAGIPDAAGMKAALMDTFRSVQSDLAKVIGGDPANTKIAEDIFKKLKAGVVEVETGIRGKIQGALLDVLRLSERIAAAQAAATKNVQPVAGPAGMSVQDIGNLRGQITSIYPPVPNASLSSVTAYQAAINSLMGTVTRSKVTMTEFAGLFNQVSRNPSGDFAGTNQKLGNIQTAIQRVIGAYNAMGQASNQAGQAGVQAGRSLYVSFDQFIKLLEVQIIHRVFGNLITEMQQSISKAAELQVKISEVMTVSQGSNFTNDSMSQFIRQRSEMFNRPQGDVTEGLYQAFSNQIIQSQSDVGNFDQALRLSRITVSTVADSVNLLSSVMKSYHQTNTQAEATVNSLFKAVELGRFRVKDLADTFGRISVVGSQAGVELNELLAIMAHLSITGLRPAEAETQISSIMNAFMRPSAEMTKVLQSWGFQSGEAAIRVLTLTGAIAKLNEEVQSGRHNLTELTPNVRAIRGITGARDTGEISNIQNQLNNAAPSANAANDIVGSNMGTQFQQEVEKIKNLFLDLGKTIGVELQKLAEPWGGLSALVKTAGSAIGEFASIALQAVTALSSLGYGLKPLGIDLGTLIKLWIDYKLALMAWSTVSAIVTGAQSLYATLQLKATADSATNTVATAVNTAAKTANATASTVAGVATTGQTVTIGIQTAQIQAATTAQIAWAGASTLAGLALGAIPIIAVGLGIAYLTGQLDPLIAKLNGTADALERIKGVSDAVAGVSKEAQTSAIRDLTGQESAFNQTIQSVTARGGQAFQELGRQSNSLVEAQRVLIGNTSENARVALRGISDEMRTTISDLQRQISESRRYSEESVRRGMSFGDRDQADSFKRQMELLGRKPEIVKPIDTKDEKGQEQLDMENKKFAIEKQQFMQQQGLMQQRINQLVTEGNQLAQNGDEASMQSSRRKFEEARRLMEQFYQSQDNFSKRSAENEIANGRARPNAQGVLEYQSSIGALQRSLQQLTQTENSAEEAHRRRLAAASSAAQAELVRERGRQQVVTDSIRQLEQLKVLDDSGRLKERYQGAQGLQNFNQDFNAARGRLNQAMDDPGGTTSPEIRFAAMQALQSSYFQMRAQLEQQQAVQDRQADQNRFNQRMQDLQRLNEQATRQRQELIGTRADVTTGMGAQITSMMEQVNNAAQLITGRQAMLGAGLMNNIPERDRRNIQEGQQDFRSTIPELNQAREAYARAQGTDAEAAAFARLRAAVTTTDAAYRNLFALAGDRRLNNSQLTGNDVQRQQTNLAENVAALASFYERQQQTAAAIERANAQLTTLRGQTDQAAQALGLAAQAANVLGQAANQQAPAIDNFTATIRRLADQMERLRNAPQLPVAPGQMPRGNPAAPIDFEDEGFASGGLIGGRFNSFGPDDRLASVRTGEFVVNPASTSKFYSQLVAINSGRLPSFASGGFVGESSVTNVGDIAISVHDAGDPNATARAVLGTLRRELRRGNGKLS